jgi:predicted  nucleic acid-binding Zn-ribbon protein
MMKNKLMALIALQDIDEMVEEATDPERAGALEDLGFKTQNVDALVNSRKHLADQLDKRTLNLYERVRSRYGRAVVPVEGQTCLGCFMGLPTKNVGIAQDKLERVDTCENCGRILYWL